VQEIDDDDIRLAYLDDKRSSMFYFTGETSWEDRQNIIKILNKPCVFDGKPKTYFTFSDY